VYEEKKFVMKKEIEASQRIEQLEQVMIVKIHTKIIVDA
jgi:hypothetical protein